ncbi:MAG: ATP-binding protein [Phycisphaerales bacterium]
MVQQLSTNVELWAVPAEELSSFSGLKLLHIKRVIEQLTGLIGRDGIFDEYTKHDVSHVDAMLQLVEQLVPSSTVKLMSPTDWLMITLAVYFHDLGMLVTKAEYQRRGESLFPAFKDKVLFADQDGIDYKSRVSKLPPEELERYLYQEFVRQNHAVRVKNWILGRPAEHLGVSHAAISEVDKLLSSLDPQFRKDLALVCESHHLNDLDNVTKYKVSQPYGNSDTATANVQYAAILLRSADLLHITQDRTPSILFRVIAPTDPISQEEWAKQHAVKRVRTKFAKNSEGAIDDSLPRDTIEVFAYFSNPNGFFGLTSYLKYAENQLKQSAAWAADSQKRHGSRFEFPWRQIDDTNIETDGFIKESFAFSIDQTKILDLLIGHTLYNDTDVVLREITQNAIDAVRLQRHIDAVDGKQVSSGKVQVVWDSDSNVIEVRDDGTGMTQQVIQEHLLKVGSSKYQDRKFKETYPGFHPISRFGIGLLSAFMIADNVEIITSSAQEEDARQLSLRSVHGRYLIKLLPKHGVPSELGIVPHGTVVRMHLRASAKLTRPLNILRKWFVVPGCA